MQKGKITLSKKNIVLIALLLILLVLVRLFEGRLFYDPLIEFFKHEGRLMPEYDTGKLFLNVAFRYFLNTFISLGIIWLIFKDRAIFRLTTILYIIFFIVLALAMYIILQSGNINLLLLFYVRRFLIQPLFLILFVPAFYYQKKMASQ
jgi:exosortase F-associated protein